MNYLDIKNIPPLGENMTLHHMGYACDDINAALSIIKNIYYVSSISEIIYDEIQKSFLCFLTIKNGPNIELVSGESVKNITKNGINLYHLCYEVPDLAIALNKFKNSGATQLNRICPAKLFENRDIVFIQTKIGLIELLESKEIKSLKENRREVALLG